MKQESRTAEERKEELRAKFQDWFESTDHTIEYIKVNTRRAIFEFLYSQFETYSRERVEALEKQWMDQCKMKEEAIKKYQALESKLSTLEETLKAADEVIKQANELLMEHVWHDERVSGEEDYSEALEKYESLKQKV